MESILSRRRELENQLTELMQALTTHHVDMDTSLTTPDGFPRSDIDVAQIRSIRRDIIRGRNDLQHVMVELEQEVKREFSRRHANTANGSVSNNKTPGKINHVPFALVKEVFDNSPASIAGLRNGDTILQFGSANASNHNNLTRLASIVQTEPEIDILVADIELGVRALKLRPNTNWGGRGALGAHVIPL